MTCQQENGWWDRCYHVVCKAIACITRCWLETQPFLLQSSFPNVSRKAAEDNPSAWALELMWEMREKLLVWVWSSPGQCGHLGKEQEDRRHLFSLSSPKLPSCLYLGCSNKIKNNFKKTSIIGIGKGKHCKINVKSVLLFGRKAIFNFYSLHVNSIWLALKF